MGSLKKASRNRIEAAMKETGAGKNQSKLRSHPDIANIVADLVTRRRTMVQIAESVGVTTNTLGRFKKEFVTEHVSRVTLAELGAQAHQEQMADAYRADVQVNDVQEQVQDGLMAVMKKREALIDRMHGILDSADDDDFADKLDKALKGMKDQTADWQRTADVFAKLSKHETQMVSLKDHPDMQPLLLILAQIMTEFPEVKARFEELRRNRQLVLDVAA